MVDATLKKIASLIPLSEPQLGGNEWKYVNDCLDTNWVSSVGSYVDRFEQMVADYVGARYAVATVNGTAALHIALLMANIQPDDEVLVSTLTFIAPANAIRYAGAWPVLIDAEPIYWQMDPQRLTDFLEHECSWTNGSLRNRRTGRRVRAVLPVHILGHPCDMQPIIEVARKFDLLIIEDATESLGAHYRDSMVGHLGDVACFSFNGNKIMTTGGGGMIVTDNEAWARRGRYLTTQAKDDPIEYVHRELGYNYRLPNVLAAIGCAQMEQLPGFIDKKRSIADNYTTAFKSISGLTSMLEAPWARSIFWLYTVLVNESEFGLDSRALMHRLAEQGIQSRPLWQPLHRSPINHNLQVLGGEVADELQKQALSLPSSVGLTESEQQIVIEAVASSHG
jgi:perosamine synthetase